MADRTRLTAAETVYEEGSWLFTVRDQYGEPDEVLLVPCEDGNDSTGDGDPTGGGNQANVDGGDGDGSRTGANGTDVRAWVNRCTHEAQRLDRGFGAPMRDGEIICPKHGSMFDACSGYCDNGEAADTTLVDVDVTVEDGDVYLVDHAYNFAHEGSIEDGDAGGDGADDSDAGGGNDDDAAGDDADGGPGAVDGSVPSWASDDDDDDGPSSTSHISL